MRRYKGRHRATKHSVRVADLQRQADMEKRGVSFDIGPFRIPLDWNPASRMFEAVAK